jgi:5-hydroxyisourate hydrolase-like protein (transthyretin family)
VKRPKFGLDTVAGRPIKGAKIGITRMALAMEQRIEKALTERLGRPRSTVGRKKKFGRGAAICSTKTTSLKGTVKPLAQVVARQAFICHRHIWAV